MTVTKKGESRFFVNLGSSAGMISCSNSEASAISVCKIWAVIIKTNSHPAFKSFPHDNVEQRGVDRGHLLGAHLPSLKLLIKVESVQSECRTSTGFVAGSVRELILIPAAHSFTSVSYIKFSSLSGRKNQVKAEKMISEAALTLDRQEHSDKKLLLFWPRTYSVAEVQTERSRACALHIQIQDVLDSTSSKEFRI